MPVRLRISLQGKRNSRIMHIVASHAGASRDSKPLETLAIFSPRVNPDTGEKRVEWAVERMRYWLGVGAQPSKTVLALLERVRISHPRTLPRARLVVRNGADVVHF
ncbi:ribosomal protein S16 [Calocera cornea HHB12733]|uniref:Ribosomal protein S16 n=1 Tax=Calocera cornea HHB12733 TaxID=1353952 RepID=A0A165F5S2_9BASI|nr:ribosomal protein S16 [Calocera cornea HHB12733]